MNSVIYNNIKEITNNELAIIKTLLNHSYTLINTFKDNFKPNLYFFTKKTRQDLRIRLFYIVNKNMITL